jgi:hypothetical protein
MATWERMLEFAGGDNYWIRDVMSPMVEISEDYLRFSAFLKGVSEVGLEPAESGIRGFTAASWVKTHAVRLCGHLQCRADGQDVHAVLHVDEVQRPPSDSCNDS